MGTVEETAQVLSARVFKNVQQTEIAGLTKSVGLMDVDARASLVSGVVTAVVVFASASAAQTSIAVPEGAASPTDAGQRVGRQTKTTDLRGSVKEGAEAEADLTGCSKETEISTLEVESSTKRGHISM